MQWQVWLVSVKLLRNANRVCDVQESLRTMTVDEYLHEHPEAEKKIRKELEAGDWSY